MNTPHFNDTIAAVATAPGGPIGVIRLSGPQAVPTAEKVWRSNLSLTRQTPRKMYLGELMEPDGVAIDRCMAVRFAAPASYTGEDMVEIHAHGGGLVIRQILLSLLNSGARHADPGEFTRRAFLNGKMDLTQAEAVADIIEAQSEMALRLGKRQLDGRLGNKITDLHTTLHSVLADIESQLDFSEENLEFPPLRQLTEKLQQALEDTRQLQSSSLEGEVLRHGIRLVLAGPPNVGKSSLMNAFLGRERAIVTHLPGTTRDTLEEFAHVRGIPVRLIDTAGIREAQNTIENAGIERTFSSMQEAQVILWVTDASESEAAQTMPNEFHRHPVIQVANKTDLLTSEPISEHSNSIHVSAITGTGLEKLFDAIEKKVWQQPHEQTPEIAVSPRHAALLAEAQPALQETVERLTEHQLELAAIPLRTALEAIGKILGKSITPDILDTIFSRFCVGK